MQFHVYQMLSEKLGISW